MTNRIAEERERWLPAVGYHGHYMVSSYGRVKSMPRPYRRKEQFLSPTPDSNGHLQVFLTKGKSRKTVLVHRLVLEAFVGPKPTGSQACHWPDADKRNNRVTNLQWGTHAANIIHRSLHGQRNLKPDVARSIKAALASARRLPTGRMANGELNRIAKEHNVPNTTVININKGSTWRHLE